ncbi:MAG: ATP-binding protein [Marmoricola sp.]
MGTSTGDDAPTPTKRRSVESPPPSHPSSVAGARAATADFFATLGDARTIDLDDALLAVSELVTNALDAGADEIHLELTHRSGALTISVEDNGPGWPAARPADADG